MLYDRQQSIDYIIRIYAYLSGAVKIRPHSIKPDKELHIKVLDKFLATAPYNAGVDFIWRFLSFQFYVLATQDQKQRQAIGWFLGEKAFERYKANCNRDFYYYVTEWLKANDLKNPVRMVKYKGVSDAVLLAERYKMSRLSGPNYCRAKYGDSPHDTNSEVCNTCPFEMDCALLFDGPEPVINEVKHSRVGFGGIAVISHTRRSTHYDEDEG